MAEIGQQPVVHLTSEEVVRLAQWLMHYRGDGAVGRLWVDDGGIKVSVNRRTWSLPIGQIGWPEVGDSPPQPF